jgi:tetratricopeptide (TPR) repeat protein
VSPQESSSAKPQYGDEGQPSQPASNGTSPSKSGQPADADPDAPHPRPVAKPGVLAPEDSAAWDPFHAEQDIEVGTFYMHKGDTDAAIARFEDAIRLRPNFAKPRILIAEIYEKRGDKTSALQFYKEYLKVFPDAPDSAKVKKKIENLSKK